MAQSCVVRPEGAATKKFPARCPGLACSAPSGQSREYATSKTAGSEADRAVRCDGLGHGCRLGSRCAGQQARSASFTVIAQGGQRGNKRSRESPRRASRAVTRKPPAPAARIKAPKGFQVELLYSVPRETQGSWVNMTVDPKGRLIVSDQYGKLYRVVLPPVGGDGR